MPSQAHSGRDPKKGKKGFSTNKGFTVIELMIVVAVLAIIMSLALPSYRTIIEKRQVTSGAEKVMAFLSSAQAEAVKRNQYVAVNFEDNAGNWCFGMTAGDNDSVTCKCNEGTCLLDGEDRVFQYSALTRPNVLDSALLGGGNVIVFDPVRGLVVDAETVEVQLTSPDQESYALNVNMTATGRVKICSDTGRSNNSVPGYEECPPK